jgi:Ca-activated chloride channel homolog
MGEMEAKGQRSVDGATAASDFARLVGQAILSGIGAAIALALVALGLATSARAMGINEAKTGTLLLQTATPGDYAVAPKAETDVSIQVTGIIARTRVAQTFHNPGTAFVEGVYVFPLPENAAVDHLWMKIGERTIEAQIMEKDGARTAYVQAKFEGKKAALIEQQRPNLFTNAVANIGPDEWVQVTIEYQQTVAFDNGEYRLRFPLAITPRYESPESTKAESLDDDEAILHPAYAPCGLEANLVSIGVVIESGVPLAKATSSYHEAWFEKETDSRTVVYLSQEQQLADRDFELVWAPHVGNVPEATMFVETKGNTDFALLMVMPPQPDAIEKAAMTRMPRETILIIDTSGSMEGTSITQAKAALDLALDTLTTRDRFNVLEFNSILRTLYVDAMPATRDNIAQAHAWVAKLRANGGTEMAPALKFALTGQDTPGFLRQVIFMTDGGVENEDDLFALIAKRLGASRLFTVGIGSAPNSHFMTKAAQFGRGTFTYIGDVREVQEKMTKLFAKIEAPVLKDVMLRWDDGTPVETFPRNVPDLYLGEPVIVTAARPHKPGTVIVSGQRGNVPWSVALTPSVSPEPNGVGALWARAKIASLMDELRTGGDVSSIRPAVLKVALDHHLVSAYTSLIAIDTVASAPGGETKSFLVKTNYPAGTTFGQIPQTDTESTLQLLLGLLALAAAGMVALIGRAIPARRAA